MLRRRSEDPTHDHADRGIIRGSAFSGSPPSGAGGCGGGPRNGGASDKRCVLRYSARASSSSADGVFAPVTTSNGSRRGRLRRDRRRRGAGPVRPAAGPAARSARRLMPPAHTSLYRPRSSRKRAVRRVFGQELVEFVVGARPDEITDPRRPLVEMPHSTRPHLRQPRAAGFPRRARSVSRGPWATRRPHCRADGCQPDRDTCRRSRRQHLVPDKPLMIAAGLRSGSRSASTRVFLAVARPRAHRAPGTCRPLGRPHPEPVRRSVRAEGPSQAANAGHQIADRQQRGNIERMMLTNHSPVMRNAAIDIRDELVVSERGRIHGLELEPAPNRLRSHLGSQRSVSSRPPQASRVRGLRGRDAGR